MAQPATGSGAHVDPELVALFNGILPEILAIQGRWDDADAQKQGTLEDAFWRPEATA